MASRREKNLERAKNLGQGVLSFLREHEGGWKE